MILKDKTRTKPIKTTSVNKNETGEQVGGGGKERITQRVFYYIS
jgi:hypothetical protein